MKKNVLKISLDIVMAAVMVLLYNSHAISLTFHEIAGLALFGMFIIHCLFNRKWVASITAKFFSPSLAPRVRFGYVIDFLLLASFVLIILSGILTSQVLFPTISQAKDSPWRAVHHFFAALSIILVGVHLGLHWSFVIGMLKKAIRIPRQIAKPLSIGMLILVLAFGTYGIATSGFRGWLAEPFLSVNGSASSGSGTDTTKNEDKSSWDGVVNDDKPGESKTTAEESTTLTPSSTPSSDADTASKTDTAKTGDKSSWDGAINGEKPGENKTTSGESTAPTPTAATTSAIETAKTEDKSSWDGVINGEKSDENKNVTEDNTVESVEKEAGATNDQSTKNDESKGVTIVEPTTPADDIKTGGDTSGHPAGEKKTEEGDPIAIASTVATYLSILGVFAAITYYIDKLLKNRKRMNGKAR